MNYIEFLHNRDKYLGENHDDFLMHYGVLGQKWGQRHWQNPDGTYTTEGKIRYFGSKKAQAEMNADETKIGSKTSDAKDYLKFRNKMLKERTRPDLNEWYRDKNKYLDKQLVRDAKRVDKQQQKMYKNQLKEWYDNPEDLVADLNAMYKIGGGFGSLTSRMMNRAAKKGDKLQEKYVNKWNDNEEYRNKMIDKASETFKHHKSIYGMDGLDDDEIDNLTKAMMKKGVADVYEIRNEAKKYKENKNSYFDDVDIDDMKVHDYVKVSEVAKDNPAFEGQPDQKIGSWLSDADNAIATYNAVQNKMKNDSINEIAKKFTKGQIDDVAIIIDDNERIAKKMIDTLEKGDMKKYMKLRNKIDDDFEKDIIEEYVNKMRDKEENHLAEYYIDSAFGNDQKIGGWNLSKNNKPYYKELKSTVKELGLDKDGWDLDKKNGVLTKDFKDKDNKHNIGLFATTDKENMKKLTDKINKNYSKDNISKIFDNIREKAAEQAYKKYVKDYKEWDLEDEILSKEDFKNSIIIPKSIIFNDDGKSDMLFFEVPYKPGTDWFIESYWTGKLDADGNLSKLEFEWN